MGLLAFLRRRGGGPAPRRRGAGKRAAGNEVFSRLCFGAQAAADACAQGAAHTSASPDCDRTEI